mmetsp:Transcript_459/g.555  ORF Transcript_459/g.555 Transcript_459/m.555 type:complete len:87 (-) Transcript_459:165-425(-)
MLIDRSISLMFTLFTSHSFLIIIPPDSLLFSNLSLLLLLLKRKLGLVVVRGTQVSLVSPNEGREEIANPFLEEDDDDDDDEEEVET